MPRRHLPRIAPSGNRLVDRRAVLRGGLGLGAVAIGSAAVGGSVLAGCGGGSATEEAGDTARLRHTLLATFPRSVPHIAAGTPTRLPFLVTDDEGVPLESIDGPVRFTVLKDGEPVGDPVEVRSRAEGIPRAYVPLTFTFPEPAVYELVADYDGTSMDAAVQAFAPDEVGPPVVGEALPPVATPTPTASLDVNPICTRVPACPFHSVSLPDALAAGTPVVVMVSTPAYCQTAVCGPLLDILMAEAGDRSDLTVIHSEVYLNPAAADNLATAPLAPLPDAYQLPFEPVMFVADATGTLVARADVVVDRTEMRELLALV